MYKRQANIRVTFKNNYDKEEGQILEPTVTTGSGYEVEDISWSKALEKWNPGSKITASVTPVSYTHLRQNRRLAVTDVNRVFRRYPQRKFFSYFIRVRQSLNKSSQKEGL